MNEIKIVETPFHPIDKVIALSPLIDLLSKSKDQQEVSDNFVKLRETISNSLPKMEKSRTATRLDFIIAKAMLVSDYQTIEETEEIVTSLIELAIGLSCTDKEFIVDMAFENGLWAVEMSILLEKTLSDSRFDESVHTQILTECISALNQLTEVTASKSLHLNIMTKNAIATDVSRRMLMALDGFHGEVTIKEVIEKFQTSIEGLTQLIKKTMELA
ncbi:hypothetical protein [Marinomonas sp. 2405UD68-3]|uniref:hypothetical protein n=1 Tax=Marinomonas sp. 2405UD68-3 TaxID=3391835 RepID=UPI0039C9F159